MNTRYTWKKEHKRHEHIQYLYLYLRMSVHLSMCLCVGKMRSTRYGFMPVEAEDVYTSESASTHMRARVRAGLARRGGISAPVQPHASAAAPRERLGSSPRLPDRD